MDTAKTTPYLIRLMSLYITNPGLIFGAYRPRDCYYHTYSVLSVHMYGHLLASNSASLELPRTPEDSKMRLHNPKCQGSCFVNLGNLEGFVLRRSFHYNEVRR